jgi:hypothetical protein
MAKGTQTNTMQSDGDDKGDCFVKGTYRNNSYVFTSSKRGKRREDITHPTFYNEQLLYLQF